MGVACSSDNECFSGAPQCREGVCNKKEEVIVLDLPLNTHHRS
jgi:hypothetical protein